MRAQLIDGPYKGHQKALKAGLVDHLTHWGAMYTLTEEGAVAAAYGLEPAYRWTGVTCVLLDWARPLLGRFKA